jgi:endoglucanase
MLQPVPRVCALAAIGIAAAITAVRPAISQLTGVNISGAELNYSVGRPGRVFFDYIYPSDAEFDYFRKKGANVIRVPVRWERLQHEIGGPIDPDELKRLLTVTDHAARRELSVIIDIHNFGMFKDANIGSASVPEDALARLWGPLAKLFTGNSQVIFGLMNEPAGVPGPVLRQAVDAALSAIRKDGAKNLVLVPGIGWSGAFDFVRLSGDVLGGIDDPAHNFAYEMHQYFDSDHSGTHADCAAPKAAVAMLTGPTQWLRSNHARGFLGEFAAGRSVACLATLSALLDYLTENKDVWLGWTYWAAGPWWGDYHFAIEPKDGRDRPQMTILDRFFKTGAPKGKQ